MSVARSYAISLHGATGHLIEVEGDVSAGLVAMTIVGRPDASLNEAKDRCKMAILNSGLQWPNTRRITVLLSPADLLKRGSHFDLAIAVAVLAASGQVPTQALAGTVFAAELTLHGGLRCVTGVVPMAMAAVDRGMGRIFVAEPQVGEAALVPGLTVLGMRSLAQVVAELRGEEVPEAPPVAASSASKLVSWQGADRLENLDLSDLVGIPDARFALEVAAAGGHHLLLSGPRGAGKTSVAERVTTILPDLADDEALELTAVHSLGGTLTPGQPLNRRPPFVAPHHSASSRAILGGGNAQARPGEMSRAHCGVLFLDEFPLFPIDVIEALRQPLESGEITIARGDENATYPARGIVILAANPCPCGEYTADIRTSRCECSEVRRREYRRKLTGPVVDRIDIVRHLSAMPDLGSGDPFARAESSAVVLARVKQARVAQRNRFNNFPWRLNAHALGAELVENWPLPKSSQELIRGALRAGQLTRRGATRVHRLALTIADLAEHERPDHADVTAALALRLGAPLPISVVLKTDLT
jgi:magnesium chelatase family protein